MIASTGTRARVVCDECRTEGPEATADTHLEARTMALLEASLQCWTSQGGRYLCPRCAWWHVSARGAHAVERQGKVLRVSFQARGLRATRASLRFSKGRTAQV